MGKAFRESSIDIRLGKGFQIGNVYSYTVEKDFLICVCGQYKIGWQETVHQSDLENTHESR